MKIGQAWVRHAQDHQRQPLTRHSVLREGDWIITDADGVLQLKMQDDALVMVQPRTRLQIEVYRYRPDEPTANRIRLRVEEGQIRWLTGKGGELYKPGFRLNTPIAAIGIRGTDFETHVRQDRTTQVRLHAGAVVVAPLDDTCRAAAYGPCGGKNAVLLDERHKDFIVEIRPDTKKPALKRALRQSGKPGNASEARVADSVLNTVEKPLNVPSPVPGIEAMKQAPFQWGRYATASSLPGWPDVGELLQQGWKPMTATEHLVLFGHDDFTAYPRGRAAFDLQAAEAWRFNSDATPAPVKVKDGRLNMDFDQRTFSTTLTLQKEAGGTQVLAAEGPLRPNGLFYSREGSMRVQGTLSGQADEAAYLFSAPDEKGQVEGATYWRR